MKKLFLLLCGIAIVEGWGLQLINQYYYHSIFDIGALVPILMLLPFIVFTRRKRLFASLLIVAPILLFLWFQPSYTATEALKEIEQETGELVKLTERETVPLNESESFFHLAQAYEFQELHSDGFFVFLADSGRFFKEEEAYGE